MTNLSQTLTHFPATSSRLWAQNSNDSALSIAFDTWAVWAGLALPALGGLLLYLAAERRHAQTLSKEVLSELTSGDALKSRREFTKLLFDPAYCPPPNEVEYLYTDVCWVFQRGYSTLRFSTFPFPPARRELNFHVQYIARCILEFHYYLALAGNTRLNVISNNHWLWQQIGDDAADAAYGFRIHKNTVLSNKLAANYALTKTDRLARLHNIPFLHSLPVNPKSGR